VVTNVRIVLISVQYLEIQLVNHDDDVKPLIFIPSPRDISLFKQSVALLDKYDRYWVKYLPENEAYSRARTKFLNENYTHLVILPDDLIVTSQQVEMIVEDVKRNDYAVISGITNVDIREKNRGKYCVSKDRPLLDNLTEDSYHWLTEEERQQHLLYNQPIIEVMHVGFPLTFIRKDIVQKIQFKVLPKYSCCIDVQFCLDCYLLGIPIFVDLRVVGYHLKIKDGIYENFGMAQKNPVYRFEPATTTKQ
jgi:hypothetical protein